LVRIEVLKTNEIKKNLHKYTSVFNNIFTTEYTLEYFLDKYSSGLNGYSLHSIAYENDEIVGSFTIIPHRYQGIKEIVIGLGCDAFIIPSHRFDELLLYKLFRKALPHLKNNNIAGIISIPNPKAKRYWKLICKWETIDFLKIQTIPINFLGMHFLFKIYLYTIYFLCNILEKNNDHNDFIQLNQPLSSLSLRYPKKTYKLINTIYYREIREGNLDVIYLLNHSLISSSEVLKACLKLIKKNKKLDFIMIGSNRTYFGFIPIPKKLIKRDFPIMIYSIEKSFKDLLFTNLNIDLGSFDNR
jgi:hypothetical protein